MPLSKAAVGLALVAAGTAACLGNSLAQRGLLKPSWAAPAAGETWALARYEGWLAVLFAQCAAWLAVAGITRWVLWGGRQGRAGTAGAAIYHRRRAAAGRLLPCTSRSACQPPRHAHPLCRLGSSKAIGPNVQLAIFHDANALVGVALAIALHGSGAACELTGAAGQMGACPWRRDVHPQQRPTTQLHLNDTLSQPHPPFPLLPLSSGPLAFLCAGKLLVAAAQAVRLPRSVAATAVGLFCGVALGLANLSEGASLVFWAEYFLGAGSPWVKTAAMLDRFQGVAPYVFGVGVTFRYTLMRYFRWGACVLHVCLPWGVCHLHALWQQRE